MASSVPDSAALRRALAAELRQVAALVEESPGYAPALATLHHALATAIPQIPQRTGHLLDMPPEVLKMILNDFSAVEVLLVAQVCSQLAGVVAELVVKLEGVTEPGVLLDGSTEVWGRQICRGQIYAILRSIIQLKPDIRLVCHQADIRLALDPEYCTAYLALLCQAINSVKMATIGFRVYHGHWRRLFETMVVNTNLKVLRINMSYYYNLWMKVDCATMVKAVSKLERLEVVIGKSTGLLEAILLAVSRGSTSLTELVLIRGPKGKVTLEHSVQNLQMLTK